MSNQIPDHDRADRDEPDLAVGRVNVGDTSLAWVGAPGHDSDIQAGDAILFGVLVAWELYLLAGLMSGFMTSTLFGVSIAVPTPRPGDREHLATRFPQAESSPGAQCAACWRAVR
ncbi:MAG: hypothetical protein J2P22_19240 [Nocardioides sp.]|nr:hypothetical protein [Nocardioides sp.]